MNKTTTMNLKIRQIEVSEYSVLEEFVYHALFLPPGVKPPPREVIYEPNIYVYIKDFGGKDDCGVVAESTLEFGIKNTTTSTSKL